MANFKIKIPSMMEEKPIVRMETNSNINDRVISATIEAAKNNDEVTEKITGMVMSSLDISKFKERLVEEALKDPEVRNKVMLELLKKL